MYTKKNINEKKKKVIRRTSVAMQQMNNIFKNQINNKDSGIIDSFIKEREKNRRRYSQSLIMPYIPLTRKQKVKEIVNMDKTSANRFNEYSHIFDHIKHQISDINNSLLSGNILNNSINSNRINNYSRGKSRPENSMFKPDSNIDDKEENIVNYKLKSRNNKYLNNKKKNDSINKNNNDNDNNNNLNNNDNLNEEKLNNNKKNENIIVGLSESEDEEEEHIDNKTLDENIRRIYLNYSPAPNSLRGTKSNNRKFKNRFLNKSSNSPKTERKYVIKNRNSNNRDFYYEPTLDDNNKKTYSSEIKEIKYCKCQIF